MQRGRAERAQMIDCQFQQSGCRRVVSCGGDELGVFVLFDAQRLGPISVGFGDSLRHSLQTLSICTHLVGDVSGPLDLLELPMHHHRYVNDLVDVLNLWHFDILGDLIDLLLDGGFLSLHSLLDNLGLLHLNSLHVGDFGNLDDVLLCLNLRLLGERDGEVSMICSAIRC